MASRVINTASRTSYTASRVSYMASRAINTADRTNYTADRVVNVASRVSNAAERASYTADSTGNPIYMGKMMVFNAFFLTYAIFKSKISGFCFEQIGYSDYEKSRQSQAKMVQFMRAV